MKISRASAALAAALLLSIPLPASAQRAPAQQRPVPDSVQALYTEAQRLAAHIREMQYRALESDPALQRRQEALRERVEAAVDAEHPELAGERERLQTIRAAVEKARAAQDEEAFRKLIQMGAGIAEKLEAAEAEALARQDIAAEAAAFRAALVAGMRKVDPGIEALMDRVEALGERLRAARP